MEEIPMNKLKHAAAKKVFAGVADYAVDQVHKNPEAAYERLIDTAEKYLKDFGKGVNWEYVSQIINLTQSEMVLELTGSPEKLDAFLGMLSTYEIIDICRTGVTGIEK